MNTKNVKDKKSWEKVRERDKRSIKTSSEERKVLREYEKDGKAKKFTKRMKSKAMKRNFTKSKKKSWDRDGKMSTKNGKDKKSMREV